MEQKQGEHKSGKLRNKKPLYQANNNITQFYCSLILTKSESSNKGKTKTYETDLIYYTILTHELMGLQLKYLSGEPSHV